MAQQNMNQKNQQPTDKRQGEGQTTGQTPRESTKPTSQTDQRQGSDARPHVKSDSNK